MATLTIAALSPSAGSGALPVEVVLVDADGRFVTGYAPGGALVAPFHTKTASDGSASLSLTPNADITPANSYYLVTIGTRQFLIEKGSGTETLEDALVVTPSALGATTGLGDLADVNIAGVADGQRLAYDAATERWIPVTPSTGGGESGVDSVNGQTGAVVLDAAGVGAAAETHASTHAAAGSDPLSIAGSQITAGTVAEARIDSALARLASPTFTGTPAAPTAAGGTNTTQLATTAFVQAAVAALINGAPGALDTLDELAAAFGDDANFAATMTTALAGKQPLDSELTALAALTTTSYGRALLELANAAAGRTAFGLGSLATVTPTGTPNGSKFLRDDGAWATPAGGGGASNVVTARPADGANSTATVFGSLSTPWSADIVLAGTATVKYEIRLACTISGNTYGFYGLYRDGTLIDQACSSPINSGQRHEAVFIGEDEDLTADTYTYEVKVRADGSTITLAETAGANNTPYNTRAGKSFMRLTEV